MMKAVALLVFMAAIESSRGHESSNSSRHESSNSSRHERSFEGFWTSSKGVWVNVFINGSQATGYTNGATFKGSVTGKAIQWEKPAQASGELWQLQPDGKVMDREGVFWTRSVVTTTPVLTSTPVATTTLWGPKWLHVLGLYSVESSKVHESSNSSSHESSNSSRHESSFEGFWTSSKGVWVNVFVNGSQATAYTNGATFKGSVTDKVIQWERPAQADGELWQLQPDGKVMDREGVFWTRSVVTTTPPAPVPTSTPEATTTLWGPKWLHAIGLSDGDEASHEKNKEKQEVPAKTAWVLPVLGAIAMFSFVALATSRIQRTRRSTSTREVYSSEVVAQLDLDEEMMVE